MSRPPRSSLAPAGAVSHAELFASLLLALACSRPNGPSEGVAKRTLDPGWIPVFWISGDTVLFKDDDSFFTADVGTGTRSAAVRTGETVVSCVDFDDGLVFYASLERKGGMTRFEYAAYLDIQTMSLARLPENESAWPGRFNCPRYLDYRAEEKKHRHEKLEVSYLGETWRTASDYDYTFQNLIRDSDGYAALLDKASAAPGDARLLYARMQGRERFEPASEAFTDRDVGVAYDRSRGRYLIYQGTNDFDRGRGRWPLVGTWFDPAGLSVEPVAIPAGPWVVEYSFLDQLRGFSCGISCYTNMKLFLVGDRMLISIWGKLVDDENNGLFELQGDRWKRLAAYADEAAPNVVPGTDGCRLIVHSGRDTTLLDLCSPEPH